MKVIYQWDSTKVISGTATVRLYQSDNDIKVIYQWDSTKVISGTATVRLSISQ